MIIISKWFINGYEMFTNYIKLVSYIKWAIRLLREVKGNLSKRDAS